VRVFGIDPGSERTGYGCVETEDGRHQMILSGAISSVATDAFPHRLAHIHAELTRLLAECHPDSVVIENIFHGSNARSALKLGHARGVAMLAAVQAGCQVAEYTPAEVKRAVVGYGRAEKSQGLTTGVSMRRVLPGSHRLFHISTCSSSLGPHCGGMAGYQSPSRNSIGSSWSASRNA